MILHTPKSLKLLLVAMSCLATVRAQHYQASLHHYSTDDGLRSNAVSCMVQDDYGYIWIGTWNGLSRFDGYDFYNYATGAGSQIPNLHNRIYNLTIDNQQNVWMRMYDNRVFVLKRMLDQIVNPFAGITGHEEYRTYYPMTVTSSGYVLINVEGVGLYKMQSEGEGFSSDLITTGGLTVTSMAEGYQNDIWLGTNQGVHRMDLANLTVERKGIFLDEQITCLFSNGYNIFAGSESGKIMSFSYGQEPVVIRHGGSAINTLYVDSHGLIWFTDSRQGAVRLNPETGNEKHFTQTVVVPDLDARGGAFRETNGTVWVRMNRGGYGYYNRQTDEVEYFHNDPSNPWNLSNTVNATLELPEGVILESTSRRGLDKLELRKPVIVRRLLYPDAGVTMSNEIRALLYDKERKWLLLGNKAGELFITKSDSSRVVLSHDSQGHPFGRIYGLSKDRSGNYWLCSKDNGVFRITPTGSGFVTQRFAHDDQNKWSLSDNSAYASVEDKQGNIWIATYGGGVNLLTKDKNGQPIVINHINGMKSYPRHSHLKVRSIVLDKEGNVWAGTTDGILIFSYKDRKLLIEKLLPSEEEPDRMLMSNDVVCMACDSQGDMWIGTNGGGLAHAYGKDSKGRWLFNHYSAQDGMPGEEVRSLTFDKRGNVWFSTDHELCSFDTEKRIFTAFSNLEGVDETMCSEGAAVTLPSDDILFGTLCGYYDVDRTKLSTATGNMLKLRITDFWLDDKLQSPRFNDTYSYYVPDSREIVLPSHDMLVSFRFASLNYQLQHRVHYQYMMEGYDHGWLNADKSRRVSYADLPTGHYRFCVKAFLLESPEKYDMKTIEVVVPPYFLFTSGSIWFYMSAIALFAIWLMFYRQGQLAKVENKRRLQGETPSLVFEHPEDVAFMQRQHEYLEIHLSDPQLSPSELIEISGLEADDYARRLYQITRLTPRAFINDYRLRRATAILVNTDEPLADIVFKCGYADVAAFNRQMKSKIGMTPSQYRDMRRKEQPSDL